MKKLKLVFTYQMYDMLNNLINFAYTFDFG